MTPEFHLFRPSRKLRREAAGQRCVVCGNKLHFSDLVAVAGPNGLAFGHLACFEHSLAQAEAQSAQSDDPDQLALPGIEA